MNTARSEEGRRLAAEQAAVWLMAMREGALSVKEKTEFVNWLRESPIHVAEMLRAGQLDQAFGEYTRWNEADMFEGSVAENVVALNAFKTPPPRQASGRHLAVPVAATIALAIVGTWLFLSQRQSVIRTQAGERRELTLADGSVVDVAPSTEISVRMQETQRLVRLTGGQAFFHVTKDTLRQFIVEAGDTRVRAVGTAFNVSRGETGVTVTVVEGRVAVMREPSSSGSQGIDGKASAPTEVLVGANEQAVAMLSTADTPVRAVNGAAEVAWTDGKLIFNEETVAEVVRRFNQYNRAQIRILDPALAERRFSGVFEASDPESFVDFVRSMAAGGSTGQDLLLLDSSRR